MHPRRRSWFRFPKIRLPQLPQFRGWRMRLDRVFAAAGRAMVYPFHLFFWTIGVVFRTLGQWWNDRRVRYLLQGMPSLAVFTGVAVLATLVVTQDRSLLANQYQIGAQTAMAGKDYAGAQTLYERLLAFRPEKLDIKYEIALNQLNSAVQMRMKLRDKANPTKEETEQTNARAASLEKQAIDLMRSMAPLDTPAKGYNRAYLILGTMAQASPNYADAVLAERYYHAALVGSDEANQSAFRQQVYTKLAEVSLRLNKPDEANNYLELVEKNNPIARLFLAELCLKKKQDDKARVLLRSAAESLQKQAEENPENVQLRAYLAECRAKMHDYPGAILVLEQAWRIKPEMAYKSLIADLHGRWLAWLRTQPEPPPIGLQIDLIEKGLAVSPNNELLLTELARLATADPVEGKRARQILDSLQTLLTDGKDSALLHFVIGNLAQVDGLSDKAATHWELAYQRNPALLLAANNLAMLAVKRNEPDLAPQIRRIESAIRQEPNHPMNPVLFGTRGQLLMRVGRHKEAVTDLQRGLSARPNHVEILDALAVCYDKIGEADLARKFREKSEAAKKAPPKPAES